ncbi:rho guanine nucleotide exchange factor 15-like [Thrips palmi]|uniref:Rho guanine nucleotide exchange factor 15-like n=1 Tax=Thrips palmi TaxID=161013 RepID=A0A6P8YTT3_THRPL|nr:rho guanine nucleotide exchange factor 15-like [Thrips palmi]
MTVHKVLQRGWLDLAWDKGGIVRKWVILDNGVLWIHSDNADPAAEQVLPLHDAEVRFPESPSLEEAPEIAVVLGAGVTGRSRRLRLRPASSEEYRDWTTAMLEAAQLWHVRRQMAFQAVLPPVAGAPSRLPRFMRPASTTTRSPSSPAEGRLQLLSALTHFLEQAGELRERTRRAVTRAQHAQDDDENLPRFLRRAIADAVEKIWRACTRARACADVVGINGRPDDLAVYDAAIILREAVDAFVTHCSLLRDLQAMLTTVGSTAPEDPLPFMPLRCLSMVRDALFELGALIHAPEEKAKQRAALAAVDATLQRCWTELSKRPLDQDLAAHMSAVPAATASSTPTKPATPAKTKKGAGVVEKRALATSPPSPPSSPCLSFKGSTSVRRLASRLHRDVVRTSVRRARKRARTEGQALLPDQTLDDSLEHIEMTAMTADAAAPSSPSSGEDAPEHVKQCTEAAPPEVSVPVTPSLAAPRPRLANSVGALFGCDTSNFSPRPPRRWQDPALLRRRRLVCSVADCDMDTGDDDVFEPPAPQGHNGDGHGDQVKTKEPPTDMFGEPQPPPRAGRLQRQHSVKDKDLRDLSVPVTPATPNGGGRRALWCETQEVQRSGLLDRLNTAESALQEAKFEVLSSEESYLRSLDMLAHRVAAMDALQDGCLIADHERDAVTKFLDAARACSMRFASALRAQWCQDVMMRGLCTLVHKEAVPGACLQQYVHIVSLQPRAASVLAKIGSVEATQLVPLLSLPAQRASRLPLLLAAILRRLDQRTSEAVICRAALDRLNQIVFECNEALRRAEQTERMVQLGRMLRVEKSPSRKSSWSERKNSVIIRAKSFFVKSNNRIGTKTNKILTSTSSMLHLTK